MSEVQNAPAHVDMFGVKLNIGDSVIFSMPNSQPLLKAQVVRFTSKMVEIVYVADWHYGQRKVAVKKLIHGVDVYRLS